VYLSGYWNSLTKEWMSAGKELLLGGPTNNTENEQLLQLYGELEWRSRVVRSVVCVMPSSARNTTRIVMLRKRFVAGMQGARKMQGVRKMRLLLEKHCAPEEWLPVKMSE
jgi:hypothetical protein